MKKVIEFIDKLTDYIDLVIFYLGYILILVCIYSFFNVLIRYRIELNEMSGYPHFLFPGIACSVIGVYFIRSYKKKDK